MSELVITGHVNGKSGVSRFKPRDTSLFMVQRRTHILNKTYEMGNVRHLLHRSELIPHILKTKMSHNLF